MNPLRKWLASRGGASLEDRLERLRHRTPAPVFWLFGKTQSGKTSIIKFLTGADDAEIGQGFLPCTRFSREYTFPTPEAPLLVFLDTRGADEPGYDVGEDLAKFNERAHVVIVTVKALDHAQENVLRQLSTIRRARKGRPILLALTCLHDAYPQQQHPAEYAFGGPPESWAASNDLVRSLLEQRRRFEGLVDVVVPLDLTGPEEGFHEPNYGGAQLKQALIELLPAAYRQTLVTLDEANRELRDFHADRVLPHILGYSTLAATAGAIPIPWVDLLILPGIQAQMIYHLARHYGQPMGAARFLEAAGSLGMGLVVRQAAREVVKFIPYVGSVVGGALAGTSTFALGKACCYYFSAIHEGHVPQPEELKHYYQEQLSAARHAWKAGGRGDPSPAPHATASPKAADRAPLAPHP